MKQMILPKHKANAIANGVLLIGFGILFYTQAWWPGILLVLWVSLGLRQYLSGRNYDLILSTIVLLGLFLITYLKLDLSVLLPILFVVGGIYIIFREFFFGGAPDGEEKSEEIKDDIDN